MSLIARVKRACSRTLRGKSARPDSRSWRGVPCGAEQPPRGGPPSGGERVVGRPVLQEGRRVGGVEWPREQEALAAVAALAAQQGKLARLLDALGEGLHGERLAELH